MASRGSPLPPPPSYLTPRESREILARERREMSSDEEDERVKGRTVTAEVHQGRILFICV